MVYYTHYVVDKKIMFEYLTHTDTYFIYKLYNTDYSDKSFLMIYHNEYGFNVIRETKFNMNDFETNFEKYFNYEISSRKEYINNREYIPLERQFGCHKYKCAKNDIEKYKSMLVENPSINVNSLIQQESGILGTHIYHFVPNIFCVNICSMYKNNESYSAYILVEYNGNSFQLRYECNNETVYFM
jgi:hypothetical protein